MCLAEKRGQSMQLVNALGSLQPTNNTAIFRTQDLPVIVTTSAVHMAGMCQGVLFITSFHPPPPINCSCFTSEDTDTHTPSSRRFGSMPHGRGRARCPWDSSHAPGGLAGCEGCPLCREGLEKRAGSRENNGLEDRTKETRKGCLWAGE